MMIKSPITWKPCLWTTLKVYSALAFYVWAIVMLTSCATGPFKTCTEDPDQAKCMREPRGGRLINNFKLRYIVCRSSNKDELSRAMLKCRRVTMLAVR
jgi:hypothetical protein